jgi:hypothetical protein
MIRLETARQYLKFSTPPALAVGAVLAEQVGQTPIAVAVAGLTILAVRQLVKQDLPIFEAFQAGRKKGEQRGFRVGYSRRMLDEANQLAEQEES